MKILMVVVTLLSLTANAEITAEDKAALEKVLYSQDAEDFAVNYKHAPDYVKDLFKTNSTVRSAMLAKGITQDDGWRLRSLNALAPVTETEALHSMTTLWESHPFEVGYCRAVAPYDIMFKNFKHDVTVWAKALQVSTQVRGDIDAALASCRKHELYNSDLRLSAEKIALDRTNGVTAASGSACTFIQR